MTPAKDSPSNQALIQQATGVILPRKLKSGLIGDVGCALLADNGKVYTGVCAATGSNSFCAEANAIGSMLTEGPTRIVRIVAVWKDAAGKPVVVAPCGNCRQLMWEIDALNLMTEVILDRHKALSLQEIFPYNSWWREQV